MTDDVVLAAGASLLLGYVFGSLPLSGIVGRLASAAAQSADEPPEGFVAVNRLAGPGWGFLALVADLARGVLPATLAAATFSWGAGWAAGVGALGGAAWPALGRIRVGGAGVLPVVLTGVLLALEPVALTAAGAVSLAVLAARRVLRRSAAGGR
jgi:glycerol-3-phosphate acyltransferase PlsY